MLDIYKEKKKMRMADFDIRSGGEYNIHSAPNITRSVYTRIKDYGEYMDIILNEVNTSMSTFINTVFVAVLNGDIVIDRSFNNSKLMTVKTSEDPNRLLLTLRDREGNIINPTKMNDSMIDMWWGLKKI